MILPRMTPSFARYEGQADIRGWKGRARPPPAFVALAK